MNSIENFNRLVRKYSPKLMKELSIGADDVAAIFGNLGHESVGMTILQEIKPTVKGSLGGYGWAQWTGSRRRAYEAFCRDRQLDKAGDEANFQFLLYELQGPEAKALAATKTAVGLLQKTTVFCDKFERPGEPHHDRRFTWAKRAAAALQSETPAAVEETKTLPSIIAMILPSVLRHILTAVAGVLVSYGLIQPGGEANFVTVIIGLVTGALGLVWSAVDKKKVQEKLKFLGG